MMSFVKSGYVNMMAAGILISSLVATTVQAAQSDWKK